MIVDLLFDIVTNQMLV